VKLSLASFKWLGLMLVLIGPLGAAGCAGRRTIAPPGGSGHRAASDRAANGVGGAEAQAEVGSDPLAYLRRVLDRCRTLQQYTVTFTRQERRGVGPFKSLREPERIACKFRRQPFSVHMRWLDPGVKHGEATYVAGQEENKVRFVPRHGLLGLPPRVTRVDLQTPVTWGEANQPLTDFGLERMMEQTLANVEQAAGAVRIAYYGVTELSQPACEAHHLRLEFPSRQYRAPIQELFVDVKTDLPVCTRVLYPSGKLEAAYIWEDLDPDVRLTDEDFLLAAERRQRAAGIEAAAASDSQ